MLLHYFQSYTEWTIELLRQVICFVIFFWPLVGIPGQPGSNGPPGEPGYPGTKGMKGDGGGAQGTGPPGNGCKNRAFVEACGHQLFI